MKGILTFVLTIILYIGADAQRKTFSEDVYPILKKHCSLCHFQGGPTPFALDKYKTVSEKAKFIVYITEEGIMPPWKANSEYSHFSNERSISAEEIEVIRQWINDGKKRGKKLSKREADWRPKEISQVDLKLMMPESVKVPGDNQNHYMTYKIPYEIESDTFVSGFEFIPGNTEVLHHASFQVLKVHPEAEIFKEPFCGMAQGGQILDDGAFYKMLHLTGPQGEFPETVYNNSWLPGSTAQIYPEELGFELPKKGVIFFNYIHYSPTSIDQTDLSGIKFFYSKNRPKKVLRDLLLKPNIRGNQGYLPKDSVKTIRFKKTMRESIDIYTVIPHMHRLGAYFKAYAIENSGDTIPLIEIKKWDFNWQEYYQYIEPLRLNKGSIVHVEAVFNNTAENLQNPFHPPRDMFLEDSMNEESEMLHFIFLYTSLKGKPD